MTGRVSLDQLLALGGRMDDAARFDAARERFRRFLLDYVRDVETARDLIEQGQHVPDQQHQRAIQDLVVLSGRFFGFKVGFSNSLATGYCGHWESISHLHVFVDVRSDQAVPDPDPLLTATPLPDNAVAGSRRAALCVVTPLCMSRHKLVAAFGSPGHGFPAAVTTVRSLLALADAAHGGRMSHEDFVRLLESNVSLDFIVELLGRAAEVPAPKGAGLHSEGAELHSEGPASEPLDLLRAPKYWICSVASDHDTRPEEFLELVVAKRLVFGLSMDLDAADLVRQGDGLCFYVAGKGVVGHARVASAADAGRGLRDAHRFRKILQLERLQIHLNKPTGVDEETQLRFRTARLTPTRRTQTMIEISRESFETFVASAIVASV